MTMVTKETYDKRVEFANSLIDTHGSYFAFHYLTNRVDLDRMARSMSENPLDHLVNYFALINAPLDDEEEEFLQLDDEEEEFLQEELSHNLKIPPFLQKQIQKQLDSM
tara:strand:+ start:67 stop:390 length:324 start_codon:yes stop_codon:yes gene_type:complete